MIFLEGSMNNEESANAESSRAESAREESARAESAREEKPVNGENLEQLCTRCEETKSLATYSCKECDDYLCECCYKEHQKVELLCNHTIIDIIIDMLNL